MRTTSRLFTFLVLAALVLAVQAPAFGAANIVIVNGDGPNEGFNDPTPATPVGGNPGTTVGQQRLIAFQYAANVWGSILDSAVPIYVQATFDPLACNATGATLGAAGAIQIFSNFPGREYDNTWYHVALANKLAGTDLAPGPNGTAADDIQAIFNANLGQPGCLTGVFFYYGLDANHGAQIDLVTVLLHEFAHGLGFSNFIDETTGAQPLGLTDIFATYTYDSTTGLHWSQMTTDAQRQASAVNTNKVVWDGIHSIAAVPSSLELGVAQINVLSPLSLGSLRIGAAVFGPALTSPGVIGNLVQALDAADAAGPSTFDACSPLSNAAAVSGKIALVDRGTCGFTVKVKNAQLAGAKAVIVADNAPGSPPAPLGGVDATITIPSARVSQPDGNALKAALASGSVYLRLGIDKTQFAGADRLFRPLLNAPSPVVPGSSISHWDPIAFPNLLMEPAINTDLTHGVDLTRQEMIDIGWFSDGDGVPDGRDLCIGSSPSATVVIDGCNSGVPNTALGGGCKITDLIEGCADAAQNHGQFVACVSLAANGLKASGTITGSQKGAIQSCAAQADIP